MDDKKKPIPDKTEPLKKETLLTIEELAKKEKLPPFVLPGLKALKKWADGKKVTEADFDKAVKSFYLAPAGGKK